MSEHRKRVARLIKEEQKKRDKLKSLEIDYEFPGYKAVGEAQHKTPSHVHFQDSE